jgi:hypothetical protein
MGSGLRRVGGWLIIGLILVGCGKESPPPIVPAQGKVTLNGAPLPNAKVRYLPQLKLDPKYIAVGVTDDQGHYSLTCNGQQGACATDNVVTVSDADIPPNLLSENAQAQLAVYLRSLKNRPIPQTYSSPVTTPLHVTVGAVKAEYPLELKR